MWLIRPKLYTSVFNKLNQDRVVCLLGSTLFKYSQQIYPDDEYEKVGLHIKSICVQSHKLAGFYPQTCSHTKLSWLYPLVSRSKGCIGCTRTPSASFITLKIHAVISTVILPMQLRGRLLILLHIE